MSRVLGKTREMKKKSFGYYGSGGQGSAGNDAAADDLFEDNDFETMKEKEGYYPQEEEEEDESFIHDLHKDGIR